MDRYRKFLPALIAIGIVAAICFLTVFLPNPGFRRQVIVKNDYDRPVEIFIGRFSVGPPDCILSPGESKKLRLKPGSYNFEVWGEDPNFPESRCGTQTMLFLKGKETIRIEMGRHLTGEEKQTFNLYLGGIAKVVETNKGHYYIKVENIKNNPTPPIKITVKTPLHVKIEDQHFFESPLDK